WTRVLSAGAEAIIPEIAKPTLYADSESWLGRPTFWWSRIQENELVIASRRDFDFVHLPNLVFAEDLSAFIPSAEATEFRTGYHNLNDRRFVKQVVGIEYGPKRRFAFGR